MILENGYLLEFPEGLAFSDDEFFKFCQKNSEINIERDENRNIIIMSPTGSLSGYYGGIISVELGIWNKKSKMGHLFDSSSGFTLPDGSVRSPDVSWVSNAQWDRLTLEQKKKFAPICPEFVVEVKSSTDSLSQLKIKMSMYLKNGAKLGWLFDMDEETVYIYKHDLPKVKICQGFDQTVSGEEVLPGFELDLSVLKE